jgi:hypothetical protein
MTLRLSLQILLSLPGSSAFVPKPLARFGYRKIRAICCYLWLISYLVLQRGHDSLASVNFSDMQEMKGHGSSGNRYHKRRNTTKLMSTKRINMSLIHTICDVLPNKKDDRSFVLHCLGYLATLQRCFKTRCYLIEGRHRKASSDSFVRSLSRERPNQTCKECRHAAAAV